MVFWSGRKVWQTSGDRQHRVNASWQKSVNVYRCIFVRFRCTDEDESNCDAFQLSAESGCRVWQFALSRREHDNFKYQRSF